MLFRFSTLTAYAISKVGALCYVRLDAVFHCGED